MGFKNMTRARDKNKLEKWFEVCVRVVVFGEKRKKKIVFLLGLG